MNKWKKRVRVQKRVIEGLRAGNEYMDSRITDAARYIEWLEEELTKAKVKGFDMAGKGE